MEEEEKRQESFTVKTLVCKMEMMAFMNVLLIHNPFIYIFTFLVLKTEPIMTHFLILPLDQANVPGILPKTGKIVLLLEYLIQGRENAHQTGLVF